MPVNLNYHALVKHAYAAAAAKDWMKAELVAQELMAQHKTDPAVLSLMAHIATNRERYAEAVSLLEKCIKLNPAEIRFHLELAALYTRMGKYKMALSRLQQARKLKPDDLRVIGSLAGAYERAGENERARSLIQPLIEQQRDDHIIAMIWGRLALNEKKPEEAVRVMARHETGMCSTAFFYVLAQAYEKAGDIDKSFMCYRAANAQPRGSFDMDVFVNQYHDVIQTFTRPILEKLPRATHDTRKPIFIAGRPRSGTTLLEKILDAHPDVASLGELPHFGPIIDSLGAEIGSSLTYPQCIRDLDQGDINRLSADYLAHVTRLAPRAKRTVDKNLVNFQNLGMFQLLFPQAKVIHIRRQPTDNCWAIFVADITYPWLADLRSIGITHALYERLMRHWHEVLDLPILDVDYEAIVEDQEGWTRRILEFCELPWDDRCLRFYENSSGAKDHVAAPTLSYNQVRQPIYKTSVGRAAKFQKHLEPLMQGFAEGEAIVKDW